MTLVLSGDSPSFSGTFQGGTLTLGTAQNTTSGTAIDFTGIPSWAKRITVMLNGVSTNGASQCQIQLGSSTIQTSGYNGSVDTTIGGVAAAAFTSGLGLERAGASASSASRSGLVTFSLLGSNIWSGAGLISLPGGMSLCACSVTLSGTLDRIRLTTVNGTDAFDAGSVNILYEG